MTAATACAVCTTPIEPKSCRHRFCSNKCRDKASSRERWNQRIVPEPLATRRCALASCGTEFQPTRPFHRFCTPRCGVKAYNRLPSAEREARRETKVERHPNTALFVALRADVGPGKCIYCETRITSVKAYICNDLECLTCYRRDYAAMRRKRAKEARPPLPERLCKCGCGDTFVPLNKYQLYVTTLHTRAHNKQLWSVKKTMLRAAKPKPPRAKSILFGRGRALPGRTYAAG